MSEQGVRARAWVCDRTINFSDVVALELWIYWFCRVSSARRKSDRLLIAKYRAVFLARRADGAQESLLYQTTRFRKTRVAYL